jgi:broad-specificity NMP kinase
MRVLVTGVSGSGKSTLAETFTRMGYAAYDLDSVPNLFKMVYRGTDKPVENHSNLDTEKVRNIDWNCDITQLKGMIAGEKCSPAFYCGAASNIDNMLPLFDRIYILTVSETVMRHRLKHRTTNDYGAVTPVQDWIMTYKDWWENDMLEKGAHPINSHLTPEQVAESILADLKN